MLQQNPLETLCLLVGTTQELKNEYLKLAKDGNIIELAAMLIVGDDRFYEVKDDIVEDCISFKNKIASESDQKKIVESVLFLVEIFYDVGVYFEDYIKEDKYSVCKCLLIFIVLPSSLQLFS